MRTRELRPGWFFRRGDIYLANLNPFTGSEQGGTRPVLVLQNNDGNFYCPTLIVAPMTTQIKKLNQPTHYLIKNNINPIIGPMKLSEVTPRVLEKYYMSLLQTKAVIRCTDKQYTKRETPGKRDSFVTPGTVRRVHKLLNSAFTQAMKWEQSNKNHCKKMGLPDVR